MNGADAMIECVGWTLLHFLWEGFVIAIVLGILLRALRKASANSRYMAGCVALALMIAAPVATFMQLAKQPAPVSPTVFRTPIESVAVDTAPRIISIQPTKMAVTEKKKPAVTLSWSERLTPLLPLLVAGWAMGVIVLALRLSAGWLRVKRLKRLGTESMEEVWHERLAKLARPLRINRSVRIVKSALVEVPTVIGWLRPIILMPAGCLAGLSTAQVEYILAHELAHVRRHDYLVNLLQCLAETILFYHPAVWWVSRRIREEREHCCDDVAVSVCGNRLEYARTLAALEELRGSQNQLVMAAAGAPLLQRIRRLAGQSERNPSHPVWPVAAIIILTLVATLAIGLRNSRAVADETQGTNLQTSHQATAIVKSDSQAQAEAFSRQGSSANQTAPQINIEAKFFELEERDLPKSIFTLPGASNAVPTSIKLTIPKHSSQVLANVTNSIVQSFTGILSEADYQKALKAFKAARSAETPSTPSVITLVGRSAQIFVGDKIPVLTNNSPTATATLVPSGVIFDVTPTLLTNGTKLQLTTMATVTKRIDAPTTVTPPVEVAQLSMEATLEDRQTLVMGGFMAEVVTKMTDKVPVLGNIPLAGRLFRSESISKSRKYLVVFVTPTLINADGSQYRPDNETSRKASKDQSKQDQGKVHITIRMTNEPSQDGNLGFAWRQRDVKHGSDFRTNTQEALKRQLQLPNSFARSNAVYVGKGRQAILSKLDRIRIDYIKYDGLPLAEVINNLSEIAKTRDPDGTGINFFINREAPVAGAIDPTTGLPIEPVDVGAVTVKIAPALTDVRLADVLDAITKTSDKPIKYSIEDYAVVFSLKGPETVPLFTRVFHVDVPKFQAVVKKVTGQTFDEARDEFWERKKENTPAGPGGIRNMSGNSYDAVQVLIRDFLSRSGLDLDPSKMKNAGKSVFFNDRKSVLMLHGNAEDLEALERILQKIDMLMPEVPLEENPIKTDERATQQAQSSADVAKTNLVKTVKGRKEIISVLNRIRTPMADYNGLTLQEAIGKLSQTIKSGNSGQSGVNFFIDRSGLVQLPAQGKGDLTPSPPPYLARENDDLGTKVLKLPQQRAEVPLATVLSCIATNNSLQYAIEDYAVVFRVKKSEPAPLFTRVYHVSTNRLSSYLNRLASTSANSNSTANTNDYSKIRSALLDAADLDFSPTNPANAGKSIYYNDTRGRLMVHATTEDLDRIEKALERINTTAYIQIKTRFVELNEMADGKIKLGEMMGGNGVKTNSIQTPVPLRNDPRIGSFPAVTNALAVQFTGVLTPEQYKEVLTRLKQADGVDILTMPDVTTESGREAQIQAVDIQSIVTGLTTVYTNGTMTNTLSTQNLPFGPLLDIIPKVSTDDSIIEMNLVANVAEFLGYDDPKKLKGQKRTDVQIPLPRFKLRQLTSSANVLDGQTVVLGGVESSATGKPGKKQGKRKTLLVFVTPTIINADGSPYHSTIKQEAALQESK